MTGKGEVAVHSVSPQQHEVLTNVLQRVENAAALRRKDPALAKPTVVIDLDMCALEPLARVIRAAKATCGVRPGAPQGIRELAEPRKLPVLPGHSELSWQYFLQSCGFIDQYPQVDWEEVRKDFFAAVYRPWEGMRSDTAVPGLVRFIRDVEDHGGVVVFNTARRERVRPHTEAVLVRNGLAHIQLLMQPNEQTKSILELKVENLRTLSHLNIIAIFDDLTENRVLFAAECPNALMIAVDLPGFSCDRAPGCSPTDQAQVINTFERLPAANMGNQDPSFSHAHSIAELRLAELSPRLPARDYRVLLNVEQSTALVEQLVAAADMSAEHTATAAQKKLHEALSAAGTDNDRTVLLIHHILQRKQFLRGSRATYTPQMAAENMLPAIKRGEPIRALFPGLPVKQGQSGLKAFGELPDLAELGFFVRLRELAHAVRAVYRPGLQITVLTDGNHFRSRSYSVVQSYLNKLNQYLELIDGASFLELQDIDQAAAQCVGADLVAKRACMMEEFQAAYHEAFVGLDITHNPLKVLATVAEADPTKSLVTSGRSLEFTGIFRSVMHAIAVPLPDGKDRLSWSKQLYADIYRVDDPHEQSEITEARRAVLRATWHDTIHYLSASLTDQELGYSSLFEDVVRLTVSMPSAGRVGFAGLGGSALLPWHGTAAIDHNGTLSTDFAIWLYDQGFVPVYSPLLGHDQPWFMAPVTATEVIDDGVTGKRANLLPETLRSIHLRRK